MIISRQTVLMRCFAADGDDSDVRWTLHDRAPSSGRAGDDGPGGRRGGTEKAQATHHVQAPSPPSVHQ